MQKAAGNLRVVPVHRTIEAVNAFAEDTFREAVAHNEKHPLVAFGLVMVYADGSSARMHDFLDQGSADLALIGVLDTMKKALVDRRESTGVYFPTLPDDSA